MFQPIPSFSKISSFLSNKEQDLLLKMYDASEVSDWDEGLKETGYRLLPIKSSNPDKPTKEGSHTFFQQNFSLDEDKDVNILNVLKKSLNMLCYGNANPPFNDEEFPCKKFDSFIIEFPQGSFIPLHIDAAPKNAKNSENKSKYVVEYRKLNIILKRSTEGGELGVIVNEYSRDVNNPSFDEGDGYIFRPDVVQHSITEVKGSRLVWSLGAIIEYLSRFYTFYSTDYKIASTKKIYIIGPGEVGKRIGGSFMNMGYNCIYVSRNDVEGWKNVTSADDDVSLRIMCMREDDLQPSLAKFPSSFPFSKTLVLVQNGFLDVAIDPLFLSNTTRLLVYFTSKGDYFEKLQPSLVHGPLATFMTQVLTSGGLDTVEIRDPKKFISEMAIKGIWNGVLGLPLVAHKVDYSTYKKEFSEEIQNLITESTEVVNRHYNLQLSRKEVAEVIERTTKNLGWMKGGTKGLAFRNKAILELGLKYGITTPVNHSLISMIS